MIEKDLSHLRFLCVRVQKGEMLCSEDVAYVIDQRAYLKTVIESLDECLRTLRKGDEMR